ncbi:Undecaprenyl-phosphate 4-deoxy-4-formamido-L-arabinose transferase [uncultured Clostridium sp.]|nr:putative uncharacterized protein [Firmicutes bacterium CAG:212]SCH52341.1 Undecaprenyl-phosphate 4-deoxy-4-formamido-L-arabinose transferase [uncultured Clostridium sp.]
MKKLIIIPAYNESANIEKTIKMIQENAPEFDYVIINDCSTDDTKKICEKNGYNYIDLPINLGIGGAVQTGYRYGYEEDYDMAVQVDGDGQHDPKFLATMADYLEEHGLDMVIGSRFINKEGFQSSGARRMGIKYFTVLIQLLTGKKITDPTSGLRMVNRDVMKIFAYDYPKDYPEPESVVAILRQKKNVEEIPVIMKAREGGVSSISPKKSVYYMIKVTLAILIERIRK